MTVIFLPRISHTNTFRHIKPQSEPARKLGSQNGFAVHWTGRVKITTVPNRTEPGSVEITPLQTVVVWRRLRIFQHSWVPHYHNQTICLCVCEINSHRPYCWVSVFPLACAVNMQMTNLSCSFVLGYFQVEEFIMLTDPKLSLFTGTEEDINEADQRPQHKITSFRWNWDTLVYYFWRIDNMLHIWNSKFDNKQ